MKTLKEAVNGLENTLLKMIDNEILDNEQILRDYYEYSQHESNQKKIKEYESENELLKKFRAEIEATK